MTDSFVISLVLAIVLIGGAWGLWKMLSTFNSPDGERYRKARMQGPFVPLSAEEIEADNSRQSGRVK